MIDSIKVDQRLTGIGRVGSRQGEIALQRAAQHMKLGQGPGLKVLNCIDAGHRIFLSLRSPANRGL